MEYPLESSRRIEHATHILFQQALKERRESKIIAAFRNYNAALDARLKIEQWYHKEAEYRRHLIPMKEVRLLVQRAQRYHLKSSRIPGESRTRMQSGGTGSRYGGSPR